MIDVDTFLTVLYVTVDDFCHSHLPEEKPRPPGPKASLSPSEVVTLTLFAQWARFASERDFYRFAWSRLRDAFPTLPHRSQFNRLVRLHLDLTESLALHLATLLTRSTSEGGREREHSSSSSSSSSFCFEALDCSAVPVRDSKRRGEGWLAGYADIGWSNRLGWYEGFCLLTAVDPTGVITGFGFGPASTKDQQMAETFFALRHQPDPRVPSVGSPLVAWELCYYVVDKGFEGKDRHQTWSQHYGAKVVCAPKRNSSKPWPKALRRWLAGLRQIVETVYDKLLNTPSASRESGLMS
ncbi:MAG: IS982 family transposase [Actinobacteria bacterium]|nr:IS982 family transposase [Actinomycetota bacterium]